MYHGADGYLHKQQCQNRDKNLAMYACLPIAYHTFHEHTARMRHTACVFEPVFTNRPPHFWVPSVEAVGPVFQEPEVPALEGHNDTEPWQFCLKLQ